MKQQQLLLLIIIIMIMITLIMIIIHWLTLPACWSARRGSQPEARQAGVHAGPRRPWRVAMRPSHGVDLGKHRQCLTTIQHNCGPLSVAIFA